MSKLSLFIVVLSAAGPAAAAPQPDAEQLTALINAYRAAPGACQDAPQAAVAPLTPQAALANVRLGRGTILSAALDGAGYANSKADAISIGGPGTPQEALEAIQRRYCHTLLSEDYTDIGSARHGNEWTVVLARAAPPLPSATYPDWRDAGQRILEEVNTARASARSCGEQAFPPAPPLSWNPLLGETARGHSGDMALKRYFSHTAKDGSDVAIRATRNGYLWSRIGENIAFGSYTPQQAMDGWLASPGHCAHIMNPAFTEMGAAYAVTPERRDGLIYWTQVFGKPRPQPLPH